MFDAKLWIRIQRGLLEMVIAEYCFERSGQKSHDSASLASVITGPILGKHDRYHRTLRPTLHPRQL